MARCKNDAQAYYSGSEPSPKGKGYCAHAEKTGKIRTGRDGHQWIVKKDKNGRKAWRVLSGKTKTTKRKTGKRKATKKRTAHKKKKTAVHKKKKTTAKRIATPRRWSQNKIEYASTKDLQARRKMLEKWMSKNRKHKEGDTYYRVYDEYDFINRVLSGGY